MTKALTLDDLDREELLWLLREERMPPIGERALWAARAVRLREKASAAFEAYRAASDDEHRFIVDMRAAKTDRARNAADHARIDARALKDRRWREYGRHEDAANRAWERWRELCAEENL